jgi:hypothetical protein
MKRSLELDGHFRNGHLQRPCIQARVFMTRQEVVNASLKTSRRRRSLSILLTNYSCNWGLVGYGLGDRN